MQYRLKEFGKDDAYYGHFKGEQLLEDDPILVVKELDTLRETVPGYFGAEFTRLDTGEDICIYAGKFEEVGNVETEGPEEVSTD